MSTEFDQYYSTVYGSRWSKLKEALFISEKQILRKNKFSHSQSTYSLEPAFANAYWINDSFKQQHKELVRDEDHLLDYYIMDPASYLAVLNFPINSTDKVLDMCAAPGGKTLILAEKVFEHGELISNELSEARRGRLIKVVQNYIPKELRSNIWVKGWDAQFFGMKMTEHFDKVLLDAPCSGERHLMASQENINEWTLKKSEKLSLRQYSLLASAYMAVKPQGKIMYSTCSINPLENDRVVQKLIKKKKNLKVLTDLNFDDNFSPEKTEFGYVYLPDKFGFGPIYFSLIEKK